MAVNLLGGLMGVLQGRIDHVPEADMPVVLAQLNSERPGLAPLTEQDWRDFEATQVLYTTGRIIRQATPRQLMPVVSAIVGGGPPEVPPVPGAEPAQ